MKIEVTRSFYHDRKPMEVGAVIDADDKLARELIHLGKAVKAAEKPAETEKPKAKKEPKE